MLAQPVRTGYVRSCMPVSSARHFLLANETISKSIGRALREIHPHHSPQEPFSTHSFFCCTNSSLFYRNSLERSHLQNLCKVRVPSRYPLYLRLRDMFVTTSFALPQRMFFVQSLLSMTLALPAQGHGISTNSLEVFVPKSVTAAVFVRQPATLPGVPFALSTAVLACLTILYGVSNHSVNYPENLTPAALLPWLVPVPEAPDPAVLAAAISSPDPTAPGTLNGRVTYEGTPKKLKPIDMSREPNCAKFYNGPVPSDVNLTGPDNSLQNVIVYISAGAPDENFTGPVVQIKQRGCRYTPHITAVQTNQEVWVQNDDSVTHSVHPMAHVNQEWNRSQPPGTPPVVMHFTQPEFIRVRCELHPWMNGVLAVFKNSHHAVTNSNGAFALPNLPPGKYTVTAWHETYGTQSAEIVVGPGESKDLKFNFKVLPY
jgi:plastocyanin